MKYLQDSLAETRNSSLSYSFLLNLPLAVGNAYFFGAFDNAFTSLSNVFAAVKLLKPIQCIFDPLQCARLYRL